MPRNKIDLPYHVDYLSILNDKGYLDKTLDPELVDERLLEMHRAMLLGRRFDERMLNLQRQGRIGTFPPIKGQEAAHVGAVASLEDSDWMVPAFRETAAELWRGRTMESVLLYFGGYDEGSSIPQDLNLLPIAVPVGSQLLHAVGIGWAIKYRQEESVVMTFLGDGATSEGDFHEAMNFAAVYQAPVVFVCQNNQWAISVPLSRQTVSQTLAQKALAYGMPGIQVDGNDILAVYVAAKEAVNRARSGGGPTLIECITYRLTMHTTADDPTRYRTEEEVKEWESRDPIPRFQKYLMDKGLLSDNQIKALEEEIKIEIQHAVERAEQQMGTLGDPLDMFSHLYFDLPRYTQEQRAELTRELAEGEEVDYG
jgi:pyruvate dehydrogenase E1 component alpha subunit